MKLFKNKVGRPSNETLKKRKMFYVGIAASVFLVILLLTLALSSLSTVKLTGTTATFSVNEKVNLPEKTTKYLLKNGKLGVGKLEAREYYVRAVYNERGFNRVKLSKTEKGIAIYWVNASEVSKASSSSGNTSSTTKPATNYVKGDVNGDGKITDADVLDVGKNIVGLLDFNENEKSAADMDNNGKITATDAKLVQQMIANSISMTEIDGKIYVNDIKDVSVTLTISGDKFKVESLNSSILSIQSTTTNSFKVKALAEGSAKIKVTSEKTEKSVTKEYTVTKKTSDVVTIALSTAGSKISGNVYEVDELKEYRPTMTISNPTSDRVYYRWFTYDSHDTNTANDLSYHSLPITGCYSLKSGNTYGAEWGITLTYKKNQRAGKVKVYSNKSSCQNDNDSTNPNNVLTYKDVKYKYSLTYVNDAGFKIIKYDHGKLSKIGPQVAGECNEASAAYAAYIMSRGSCTPPVSGRVLSDFNGKSYYPTTVTALWNVIKEKIDAGIPLVIRVTANQDGGVTGEHWLTVVGYYSYSISSLTPENIRNRLYVIDPAAANYVNNTLFVGKGIDKPGSFKELRKVNNSFMYATWEDINSFKCS